MSPHESEECPYIPYEIVESVYNIYITALIPSDSQYLPYVDIRKDTVKISIEPYEIIIKLPHKVDIIHSFYEIKHRTLDIVMMKSQV